MLLLELFEADSKHVTFCFGRMNPPTIGHKQVLDTMKSQGGDMRIFVSQTQDKKKNPLDYGTKVKFIKEMFPEYAGDIVDNAGLNTIGKVASYLHEQGYTAATFVAGSDRLEDMKNLLTQYNGVEGKAHGFYDFEMLDFVSSGEREDGAEGVAGVSASGARLAAANNDLEAFKEATGAGELSKPLFVAVRKGMNISEGIDLVELASDDASYYKYLVAKVKTGRPLSTKEKEFIKTYQLYKMPVDEDSVDDFLKAGGKITYGKPQKGPRKPGLSMASRHIGGGREKMKASRTGKAANTQSSRVVGEAPIEMDRDDAMNPMIYGHDKANPAKLKYRMLRAAGQLKDLAARADGADASEWQIMARQFEELKMNMEQIRHALEELGKIRSKGGIRSRGITV